MTAKGSLPQRELRQLFGVKEDKPLTYTRDKILAMEPAELSLAVAEVIFKAKVWRNDRDPDARLLVGEIRGSLNPLVGKWRNAQWTNSDERAWLDCPKYAEDMSAAWDVMEHLNPLYNLELGNTTGGWNLFIFGSENIDAETAPVAICKAALLAVMDL